MKIALCIRKILGRAGGAERVLVDTANYLSSRGHEVEIWHFDKRPGKPFYPLTSRCNIVPLLPWRKRSSPLSRLSGTWVESLPGLNWLSREAAHGTYRRCLRARLLSFRPDVAVGYLCDTFPYLIEAARGLNIPVVASCHSVPARDFADPTRWDPNPYDRHKRLALLDEAAVTTVIQPEFIEWFPKKLQPRIRVLENPVTRTPGYADVRQDPQRNIILAVGRLAAHKGHETLIKSWSRIHRSFPAWKLRICGDGELMPKLEQLVLALGLKERVELAGAVADIMSEYEKAKFLAMPSLYEGFGLSAAEAMLKGLPVIAFSDCPGLNKVVVNGVNGILLKVLDKEAELAEGLRLLIEDNDKRLRLANQAPETMQKFTAELVLPKWEALLEELVV